MEIQTEKRDVYVVYGKAFLSEEDAIRYKQHQEQKLKLLYYTVSVKPDLTEGRGYYDKIIVASKHGLNSVLQYLFDKYGKPIEMVMGVSPIANWIVSEPNKFSSLKELDKFLNQEVSVGFGDHRKPMKLQVVCVDASGREILYM